MNHSRNINKLDESANNSLYLSLDSCNSTDLGELNFDKSYMEDCKMNRPKSTRKLNISTERVESISMRRFKQFFPDHKEMLNKENEDPANKDSSSAKTSSTIVERPIVSLVNKMKLISIGDRKSPRETKRKVHIKVATNHDSRIHGGQDNGCGDRKTKKRNGNKPLNKSPTKIMPHDANATNEPKRIVCQSMSPTRSSSILVRGATNRCICMPARRALYQSAAVGRRSILPPRVFNSQQTLKATSSVLMATDPGRRRSHNTYKCALCDSQFRIKSLLYAHKRTHKAEAEAAAAAATAYKRQQMAAGNGTVTAKTLPEIRVDHQCRYCDKKFALQRTLRIHLMQHCLKIPACDKRKLNYTELEHEKKAPLPEFFRGSRPLMHAAKRYTSNSNLYEIYDTTTKKIAPARRSVSIQRPRRITMLLPQPQNVLLETMRGALAQMGGATTQANLINDPCQLMYNSSSKSRKHKTKTSGNNAA